MSLFTSRRSFLKISLLTTALAFLLPERVLASLTIAENSSGRLNLYNIHTGEKISTVYRGQEGLYNSESIKELNWLLRCPYTDRQYPIDIKTLEFLDRVVTRLGSNNEVHVISGYRSPQYNKYLISQGHRVAKHSLHMEGRALDIRIPGISLADIRRTALSLRLGGVGYYPRDDFIHIDSGAVRAW
jgi:uncharacterized protein YcbK (DUF882 family)